MKKTMSSVVFFLACSFFMTGAFGMVPQLIPVQGILRDANGEALDGSYNLTFAIYESFNGDDSIWAETQTNVAVSNGSFIVYLGAVSDLDLDVIIATDELWLG